MAKKKSLKCLKSFIINNVTSPQQGFVTRFWPREMKIAKELFEKYPDEEFWLKMTVGFKINSLAWFKMQKGVDLLDLKYKEFNYKPQINNSDVLEISDRKFGETTHNSTSKKYVKDFLD